MCRRCVVVLAALSPRELDVLASIAQGHTNSAIAGALVLTRPAVE
jgi:DNA-binding CsgD family transcriptional regulator